MSEPVEQSEVRELRIALVCYGGVSLAIYMHGVIKELHALVRASRAYDAARIDAEPGQAPANPFDAGTRSEHAYFDELARIGTSGLPLCVTIDVISGTSAGGINGVCLAQGLLHGTSEDSLTRLWMNNGDLRKLLHYSWAGLRVGAVITGLVLPWRMRSTSWTPLRGDNMCRWLFDALTEMTKQSRPGGLLPEGGRLNLGVTATDLAGYDRVVPLGTGQTMRDRTFRKVFRFRYGAGVDDFEPGAMAFAARATSSFPGAFPPVSPNDFAAAAPGFDPESVAGAQLREYPSTKAARETHFADGGVLDNSPFDVAISAIAAQPAEREVVRHLVYIDPNPSPLPSAEEVATTATPPLRWLDTVEAALLSVPRHQPLLGAVEDLADFNLAAQTVGELANRLGSEVEAELAKVPDPPDSSASYDEVRQWVLDVLRPVVPDITGRLNYRSYLRLRAEELARRIVADLATALEWPDNSAQASFLRAALGHWIVSRPEWESETEAEFEELGTFVAAADVPFRERRLMFVLQGINQLLSRSTAATLGGTPSPDIPTRAQLVSVKKAAWDLLEQIQQAPASALHNVPASVLALVEEDAFRHAVYTAVPADWADKNRDRLAALAGAYRDAIDPLLRDNGAQLWRAFVADTADWDPASRKEIAQRYLGFSIWDAMIFPVVALSRLPQYSPIRVSRFNPADATAFGVKTKLMGTAVHHFAAFFKREWRENDYLWGRLDGAELILRLLREKAPDGPVDLSDARLSAALGSVLADEKATLTHVRQLIDARQSDLNDALNDSRQSDLNRATTALE